jgi:hypothetical protein
LLTYENLTSHRKITNRRKLDRNIGKFERSFDTTIVNKKDELAAYLAKVCSEQTQNYVLPTA